MYLSAKQVKNLYQITNQTLYNWRRLGKIEFKKLPSGSYVYLPIETQMQNRSHVIYARVSNTKQKDDLVRQVKLLREFVASSGHTIDAEFSDIASGMNESRKGFNQLMDLIISGSVDSVYITFRDRLTRFGYTYLENMFSKYNTKLVVLNATSEEDFQTELTQDLVSIIHHFSMRMYSSRIKMLKLVADDLSIDKV